MSARLTHLIIETVTGNAVRHQPQPPYDERDEHRALPRLIVKHRYQEFRPHGTDSVGVIVSSPKNRRSVQFFYKHDPDTVHSMLAHEFTERFASFIYKPRVFPLALTGITPKTVRSAA